MFQTFRKCISLMVDSRNMGMCKVKMATGSGRCSVEPPVFGSQSGQDPIKALYPMVNEEETPLPRCWSSKDKYSFIGLSQNNLRVHYKGEYEGEMSLFIFLFPLTQLHGSRVQVATGGVADRRGLSLAPDGKW